MASSFWVTQQMSREHRRGAAPRREKSSLLRSSPAFFEIAPCQRLMCPLGPLQSSRFNIVGAITKVPTKSPPSTGSLHSSAFFSLQSLSVHPVHSLPCSDTGSSDGHLWAGLELAPHIFSSAVTFCLISVFVFLPFHSLLLLLNLLQFCLESPSPSSQPFEPPSHRLPRLLGGGGGLAFPSLRASFVPPVEWKLLEGQGGLLITCTA
ncbi:UBAP1-MVB12-associated (UMA)-domain containing protein 1 isoform X1 [Petaurus breviceps papuanus]|uniref:UBAP1-MVB12-associated (UMA)-domain containing protein 1 isoform X1 n=1 Tax=Petaurus breviceps papuanus TaxID=3040969 RepID=UPI0036DF0350